MAAAGIGGGGEHDLPLEEVDAVLASFSGDPAAAVFAPLPAPKAAAASRELAGSGESLREGLGDVEEFLMRDYEDEAPLDGVDEFLDGILVEDGEGEGEESPPKPTGEKNADMACAGEDEVVAGVDCDDDPNSKKKWRYWCFFVCFLEGGKSNLMFSPHVRLVYYGNI